MKKSLSLILCITVVFSMGLVAFAEEVWAEAVAEEAWAEVVVEEAPEYVEVPVTEVKVTINGVEVVYEITDGKPVIVNGRTIVPFRKTLEALNATVAWRAVDKTAHCFRNGKSVMLTEGQPSMEVRNFEMTNKPVYTSEADPAKTVIDADRPHVTPMRTPENRLLVPIRAIVEALGGKIDWKTEGHIGTVMIEIGEYSATSTEEITANLVEKLNYKLPLINKTGAVNITILGNETSVFNFADGMEVEINGQKQVVEYNACSFAEIVEGTYTVTLTNLPAGYALASEDAITVEVVAGETAAKSIRLVSAPVVEAPAAE